MPQPNQQNPGSMAQAKPGNGAQPKPGNGPQPKPPDPLSDAILSPFRQWWEYFRKRGPDYYLGLLKIALVSLFSWVLLGIALLAVLAGICFGAYLAYGALNLSGIPLYAFIIAVLALLALLLTLGIVLLSWVRASLTATAPVYTDAQLSGKAFGILEAFGRVRGKVFEFMLIEWGIHALTVLPLIALGMFIAAIFAAAIAGFGILPQSGGDGTGAILLLIIAIIVFYVLMFAGVLYMLLLMAFNIVFNFVTQFWAYGFLIDGLGVVPAFRRSIGIIMKRPAEALLFYIVWGIAGGIVSIPLVLVMLSQRLLSYVFPLAFGGFGPLAYYAIYAAFMLVYYLAVLLLSTAVQSFSLPTHYLFWKRVKEGVE